MMETSIYDSNKSFYIPAIQKLAFHIPHVHIIGTNHCGNTLCEELKSRSTTQDVLCRRDYDERVVANFTHQIKSESYITAI